MRRILYPALVALLLCACNAKHSEEASALSDIPPDQNSETGANAFLSSSAARDSNRDSSRQFIRTAEMRFRVKNVYEATQQIEDIASRFEGFVTYTNLSSEISHVSHVPVSEDSTLETTYYKVQNVMTLRVPSVKLDSTLRAVAAHIDFLNSRVITADDVALQLYANALSQKRNQYNQRRLESAIDRQGKKLQETSKAEERLIDRQAQADQAMIANLSLRDQINYSTVKLEFYQRETFTRALLGNDKNIEAYEPGFGNKLLDALKEGWKALTSFVLFVTRLWAFLLLIAGGYLVVQIIRKRSKQQE